MEFNQGHIEVSNMALFAIGVDRITSFDQDTDSSMLCKMYYPIVEKRILAEYDWNFARRTVDIYEVETNDEYKNYKYSFNLPADYVAARRVRPEQYYEIYDNDTLRCNRCGVKTVEYVSEEDYNIVIEREVNFLELTYTKNYPDPMKYNPAFMQYLAYSIASEIAFMLTGDKSVVQMAIDLSNSYQDIARVEDASISRWEEYGEKPYWYMNKRDYYLKRYKDGGPNATEDFFK